MAVGILLLLCAVLLISHMCHLLIRQYATIIRKVLQLEEVFVDLGALTTQILEMAVEIVLL